ncbi:DUF6880 family protein [Psychrobacter sp. DM4]|uniref:DUF6880 family protein n=1 Tax=Psychrobacter sp. DM4 TaxID=3440637 RepID=UPI003F4FB92E
MLDDQQKACLSKLPKATLVDFIANVQGMDKLLDKKIERLLLQSDKPKLIKKLTSTLKGLRRRRKTLNYWEYNDFVTELHYLTDDVMSLYPEQPQECLILLELYMESTDSSMERVDDSTGEISSIYSRLTSLWLQVAARCYEQEKQDVAVDEQDILTQSWIYKIKAMIDDNEYGTKDNLLRHVNQLFSTSELESLVEDYKYDYQTLLTESFNTSDNEEKGNAFSASMMSANSLQKRSLEHGLIELAWALADITNFEEIYVYLSDKRQFSSNEFDKLIQFLLDQDAYEVALRYLNEDWPGHNDIANTQTNFKAFSLQRLDWLSMIHSKQADTEALYSVLLAAFELEPSYTRFRQVMTIASPAQQAHMRKRAVEIADGQENVIMAVDLWLEIGDFKRATQVASARYQEFDYEHYTTLTQWLKRLPDDTNLIRVMVYRSLLDDILDNDRTMAYGHATRYYKHLTKLNVFIDISVEGYQNLTSHQDYLESLQNAHSKKHSFWERVAY